MTSPDRDSENENLKSQGDDEGSGLWRGVDRVVDNFARSFGRESNRQPITRSPTGPAFQRSAPVRTIDESPPVTRTQAPPYSPPVNHSMEAEVVLPRQPTPIRLNRSAHAASTGPLNPVADAFEDDDCFEVTVELPGVKEADIDIEFSDGAITVTAERRRAEPSVEKKHLVRERSYGTFKRRFALPFQANPDIIDAEYLDGVLTVRAMRPPETKPRTKKIELKHS